MATAVASAGLAAVASAGPVAAVFAALVAVCVVPVVGSERSAVVAAFGQVT